MRASFVPGKLMTVKTSSVRVLDVLDADHLFHGWSGQALDEDQR